MKEMVKLLDSVQNVEGINSSYKYNGKRVPRVTSIISRCNHNDSLMYWANNLGFKRQSYSKTLNHAAEIGTQCHENIDMYLENPSHKISNTVLYQSKMAYKSFRKWFNDISMVATVEVLYHEFSLVCKYFGGTLDGLYKINGKIYLVDYKTSNHISYNYCLQLSAYRYMLRELMGIVIDGCIILQLSKNEVAYNEYVLNFENIYHLDFINSCELTFLSLTFSYYNLLNVEKQYENLQWEGM